MSEATAQFLESISQYFAQDREIDDTDWQVVFDLKEEVLKSLEGLGFVIHNGEDWVKYYKLGKELYLDWRQSQLVTHEKIRHLNLKDNLDALKAGFIDTRNIHVLAEYEDEDIECFYGAMDEVGVKYWI